MRVFVTRTAAGLLAAASVCMAAAGLNAAPLFRGIENRPADAIVLFNGRDLSEWQAVGGAAPSWHVANGYMEVRSGSIETRKSFGDCQVHVEFWLPYMPDAQGQGRANSGVYLQGQYEVQVLDSYGIEKPESGDCGGLYSIAVPLINASRPPRTWQTYDIFFRAPVLDDSGKVAKKATVSVVHNGVWIHNNVELPNPTPGGVGGAIATRGPVLLQDHGNLVRYRNIWVRDLSK